MQIYIDWLKEYTDITADMDQFCERMIMSGSNIEAVQSFGEGIEKVVVGKIVSIEKHKDADKLIVCQVDVGQDENLQIVTGATNVFVGAYVPVILHGGKLPNGTRIKKGKLRGVDSWGMLCSAKELGYEDKVIPVSLKDGIWILDECFPTGKDIVEIMGLKGQVIDFEITPNRPDCLSLIGMARETAATFGGEIRYPETSCTNEKGKASDYLSVSIKKPELCRRYTARVVTGIKIGPSPWWIQKRLMYSGMRPINNIVDITNYVMLEYGQPIHAFDIRNIKGNRIEVDTASEGEIFTTLDGTERKLTENMLMIRDAERAVAIAGVMGGLNSEIKDDTNTIVIESANFNGDSIRSTSKKLALRTEASARFEKGIDPNLTAAAADRVCYLIELLCAGVVTEGSIDIYPNKMESKPVNVRLNRVNQILGTELSIKDIECIFVSLEMKVDIKGDQMLVTPPTIRQDLYTEIDMIEEVARIYGYDKLPMTMPKGNSESRKTSYQKLRDIAKDALIGMGVSEIQTYSFVSPKSLDNIRIDTDSKYRKVVRLINPLGEEYSIMRSVLTPNMLDVMSRNYSRKLEAIKAFEIGNIFHDNEDDSELPFEGENLCIGVYGPNETFFTLKGIVSELLYKLGIRDLEYIAESKYGTYHPGRCAEILFKGNQIGVIGEIHPDVLEVYGIDIKAYCCEVDFQMIGELADMVRYYTPIPKYPSTSRDIALLVKEEVTVGELEKLIRTKGSKLLERVTLFDIYRGKQVPEGYKSVAFTLTYRADDRTLKDEEVIVVHEGILTDLKQNLGAVLRDI